jgi:hypothetical protein
VVSAIADISRIAYDASAVDGDRDPVSRDTQNRLQAFLLVIPLALFALLRSRSTSGSFFQRSMPVSGMMQCNIAAVNL